MKPGSVSDSIVSPILITHRKCSNANEIALHPAACMLHVGMHNADDSMQPCRCSQVLVARHVAEYASLHILDQSFWSWPANYDELLRT